MRIDAHQHFWKYDAARDQWITSEMAILRRDFLPQQLALELDANGIQGSIAVQAAQSLEETHFLLNLAEEHETILGVVGWVDLAADDLSQQLELLDKSKKLRGFRHIVQAEPDDRFLLRDSILRGIACLGVAGFSYDILIYPRQLPAALEMVKRCPGQHFVIDHIAKPPIRDGSASSTPSSMQSWTRDMRAIARHSNVFCKLSGMVTEASWQGWRAEDFKPYLDVVFEAFGVERLMFGSDWPVCLLAGSYRQVLQIVDDYTQALPSSDREKIFGGNAARFYRIPGASHHGLAA